MVFSGVEVDTGLGRFESDVFKLVHGKLELGEIFLADSNGERRRVK